MDDELRRLERARDAGDEEAGMRWSAERRRRGMCGLPVCTVGIEVKMDRPGVSELWWGGVWRPKWVWSIDRIEDRPGYPEELAILLNSMMPYTTLRPGFTPVRFVFRPTPTGVLAYGACHECEQNVREPQEVVIDDGPRWGSRVPLWLRRSSEFKGAVAQTGEHGPGTPDHMNLRTIIDIPTPWELVPLPPPPRPGERYRPTERPRMRFELEWEPWLCPCGERGAGRVLVRDDTATAAPLITCPACGTRGYETLIRQEGGFVPVRWWAGRAPSGALRVRRTTRPTPPPA